MSTETKSSSFAEAYKSKMTALCTEPDPTTVDKIFGSLFSRRAIIRQGAKTLDYDSFLAAFHGLQNGCTDIQPNHVTTLVKEDERCLATLGEMSMKRKGDPDGKIMKGRSIAIIRFGEKGSEDEEKIVEWDEVSGLGL